MHDGPCGDLPRRLVAPRQFAPHDRGRACQQPGLSKLGDHSIKTERTLADFIQRRVSSIEEVLTDTPAPGLRLISGAGDLLSAANIKHLQKVRVMNQVRRSTWTWC